MREFASTKYKLRHAPTWQKRLYTAFLGFMLIGVGSNLVFGLTKTGLTVPAIIGYYRGDPERLLFEKTFQELLEVTHMHAFMMPIVLLVLGHLFFLTAWPAVAKRLVGSAAVIAMMLDLLTPWAVRYAHPAWAYAKWVGGYGLGVSLLCMIAAPVYEMWFDGRP